MPSSAGGSHRARMAARSSVWARRSSSSVTSGWILRFRMKSNIGSCCDAQEHHHAPPPLIDESEGLRELIALLVAAEVGLVYLSAVPTATWLSR